MASIFRGSELLPACRRAGTESFRVRPKLSWHCPQVRYGITLTLMFYTYTYVNGRKPDEGVAPLKEYIPSCTSTCHVLWEIPKVSVSLQYPHMRWKCPRCSRCCHTCWQCQTQTIYKIPWTKAGNVYGSKLDGDRKFRTWLVIQVMKSMGKKHQKNIKKLECFRKRSFDILIPGWKTMLLRDRHK